MFFVPQEAKIPGVKTKIKNKLEWLRVDIILNWESFVKEDWIEPLNQDTDSLE